MDKVDSRRLGSHLKRLREERKLTLGAVESLSEGLGERINKSYLFRVERGKTVPTIPRLRVLAKVYKVRLATLLEILEGAFEEQEKENNLGIDLSSVSFEDLRARGIEAEREGDFPKATLFYRAAWDRALLEVPSPERSLLIAIVKHDLAIALQNAGRLDLAREEAELALEQDGVPPQLADKILLTLAILYRRLGRTTLSREILSGLLMRRDGMPKEVLAATNAAMGSVLLRRNAAEAAAYYRVALPITRQMKNSYEECILLFNIALAESKLGRYSRALKTLGKAGDLAKKKEYNLWHAKVKSEIGRVYYLKGDRVQAKSALYEANEIARRRDYYEQLFVNQYYLRRLALEEGNNAGARTAESSLRFFATRIEESFEELEAFKTELEALKEKGQ